MRRRKLPLEKRLPRVSPKSESLEEEEESLLESE